MRKWEITALALVLAALVGLPSAAFAYQAWYSPAQRSGAITVVMRTVPNGNVEPAVIRANQGDTVRLLITSEDVAHGIRIEALGIDVAPIKAGKYQVVEFVADQSGTFEYMCSLTCGPSHDEIKGLLIVADATP
jgi:heme/copper-type cytochrome/quinol oxidase subunit 2